jgi:hypothetical protein
VVLALRTPPPRPKPREQTTWGGGVRASEVGGRGGGVMGMLAEVFVVGRPPAMLAFVRCALPHACSRPPPLSLP